MWIAIAVILVAVVLAVVLMRPKAGSQAAPDAQAPPVIDGRRRRRVFGTVWLDKGVPLAWRPMGVVPIRAEGKK